MLRLAMIGAADARKLMRMLEPYRSGGNLRVRVSYTCAKAQVDFNLGEEWKVRPDVTLMTDLGKWLEPENVEVVYQ